MIEDRKTISPASGLVNNSPLGARIGKVQVAMKPPDPVMMERISEALKELSESGIEIPNGASLALRSVDGFYFIQTLGSMLSEIRTDVVSVVNYDPVRRTFILSGSGEVNDLCEFFWYAFEAFPTESVIFFDGGSEGDIQAPDQMDARVSFNISRLQSWKDNEILEDGSRVFWRGKLLDHFKEFLKERYAKKS